MDWDRIEKDWQQVKQKIKGKWERLSDDDLDAINGRRDRPRTRSRSTMGSPSITSARRSTIGSNGRPKQLNPEPWLPRTDVAIKRP